MDINRIDTNSELSKSIRIVHIMESFSPLSETFIYDYVVALQELGAENHIITQKRENIFDRPFESVHLTKLPSKWNIGRLLSRIAIQTGKTKPDAQYWSIIRSQVLSLLTELMPDVVHAHFGSTGVLVEPVTTIMGIPLVVSFHGFDAFKLPRSPIWKSRYIQLFQHVQTITTVSNYMKKVLVEELGAPSKKVHVIHVGKRIADYNFRVPEKPILNWVSVGRLSEKKGFFDCIEAFANISTVNNAQLSIIGQGDLELDLRKFADEMGIPHKVQFLGAMSHDRVIHYMQESDAFILCSKTAKDGDKEGIPTVLMEAQAIGLPCVSTVHSGIPELFPVANHWLLASEGNVSEISKRMSTVINCKDDLLIHSSILARKKIEEEFNLTTIAEKLYSRYLGSIQELRNDC